MRMAVTIRDIIEADRMIRPYIRTTPVMEVDPADFGLSWRGRLTLKLECMAHGQLQAPRGLRIIAVAGAGGKAGCCGFGG